MSNELDPKVDQWYQHRDKGQQFYVTAIDEEGQTVEVQHFDGDIEEFTFPQWRNLEIELSEEPENWSGAIEIGDQEDFGTEITETDKSDWNAPLQEIHQPERGNEYAATKSSDDYGEGYMEEEPAEDAGAVSDIPAKAGVRLNEPSGGVIREVLGDVWVAEYTEDSETGLWNADVFKHDVAEWKNTGFDSLEQARQAVEEFYDQQ